MFQARHPRIQRHRQFQTQHFGNQVKGHHTQQINQQLAYGQPLSVMLLLIIIEFNMISRRRQELTSLFEQFYGGGR